MTPPDEDLHKQERRHSGPLIGLALVAIFGVGIIIYWVAADVFRPPQEDETGTVTAPADVREGDVDVPAEAPTETVDPEPGDGEGEPEN